MKEQNLAKEKFNRLTAIEFKRKDKYSHKYWLFKCDCGNEVITVLSEVKRGVIKSCGCLTKEVATTHGQSRSKLHGGKRTPIYAIWVSMMQRCNNIKHYRYKDYGARGITVCDKWLKFEGFYEEMGDKPEELTLDRIDNNKGYCKENCRWSTWKEQANNKRSSHFITYRGKTQTLTQWANELGMCSETLYNRIGTLKWTEEKALTTEVGKRKKRVNRQESESA